MKKILLFILAMLLFNNSWAQEEAPPEMFKFQAMITKPNGNPVMDKTVGVEIAIYQSNINETPVYSEIFTPTTNKIGLINLEIGNGTPTFGLFSDIPWEAGEFFIGLGVDIKGGTNYTSMGASQLLSVPYALLAKKALSVDSDLDTDPNNEIELPETANENDVLTFVDGTWVAQSSTDSFSFYYADKDEDGFGDKWNVVYADIAPEGFVPNGNDCNENDTLINPDAIEICDGIDNNCDGVIDEGVKTTYYADTDGDEYGDNGNTIEACSAPSGYVSVGGDCDDTNLDIYPGTIERCNNGLDDDCDGTIDVNCLPQVGDFYEGGVVYYIFQPGEPGYVEDETHGLVCSINYQGKTIWTPVYFNMPTNLGIGTGASNTDSILETLGDAYPGRIYAANHARNYDGGGYTDWFLPSLHELVQISRNHAVISATSRENGGQSLRSDNTYWSSSQYLNTAQNYHLYRASSLYVISGSILHLDKLTYRWIRSVRAF